MVTLQRESLQRQRQRHRDGALFMVCLAGGLAGQGPVLINGIDGGPGAHNLQPRGKIYSDSSRRNRGREVLRASLSVVSPAWPNEPRSGGWVVALLCATYFHHRTVGAASRGPDVADHELGALRRRGNGTPVQYPSVQERP